MAKLPTKRFDHGDIVDQRVRRIARQHECSVAQVEDALDRHPIELDRNAFLRRTLAMELVELDELQAVFREKSLAGDTAAGSLLVKIFERRQVLLGIGAPAGHAVTIVQHEPARHLTSTQKLELALERLRATDPNRSSDELEPSQPN